MMTDSSRSSRSRYWSASIFRPVRAISANRWSSPSRARRWMYESSVSPSGTWNLGRCLPTRSNSTLQRWAMSHELCTASRHSAPTRVVEGAARGDGHQHLVRLGVLALDVMAVGGGDELDLQILR